MNDKWSNVFHISFNMVFIHNDSIGSVNKNQLKLKKHPPTNHRQYSIAIDVNNLDFLHKRSIALNDCNGIQLQRRCGICMVLNVVKCMSMHWTEYHPWSMKVGM